MTNGDTTDLAGRAADEVARYRDVTNVHDLPAIYGYWEQNHVAPLRRELGFESLSDVFLGPLMAASHVKAHVRAASLGSGNGELELALATQLRQNGVENFTIERFELNDAMRDRAERHAASVGLKNHLVDLAVDLNVWKADRRYDIVMANHSLHHVVELEHLFKEVHTGLGDDGIFVINDMIGRNGHMRWPEALDIVRKIWAVMPDRYRFNHQLQRHETEYVNWDCSREGFEGVRAQDILPLLNTTFYPEVFLAFANVIDLFVDRGFGHNFDVDRADDRAFIDAVAQLDEVAITLGLVKPTHLVAQYRTHPVACRYIAPLSPTFSVRPVSEARNVTAFAHGTPFVGAKPDFDFAGLPDGRSKTRDAAKKIAFLIPPIRRLRDQRNALAAQVAALQGRG